MSVNRALPSVLIGALLVACSNAPVSPVEPASQLPSAVPTATPTPTPTASQTPSPTPAATPSPSPRTSSAGGSSRTPTPLYKEAGLAGLTIAAFYYTALPADGETLRGRASMAVNVDGATRMVEFDETDHPVSSDAFDSVKVWDGGNVRTFGADQDFVNFWVQMPAPALGYRVQSEPTEAPADPSEPPEGALSIRALPDGRYEIGRYHRDGFEPFVASNVTEAAEECLYQNEFKLASLASLSGIYVAMRERESTFESRGYRLRSFRAGSTRFPMPPSMSKKGERVRFNYRTLDAEPAVLNAGAALLQEIIRLRLEAAASPSPIPTPTPTPE